MTTDTPHPKLDRLAHTTGLQAWARDTEELPEAAARLLVTANRMAIVPHVILFDLQDGDWSVALLGDN